MKVNTAVRVYTSDDKSYPQNESPSAHYVYLGGVSVRTLDLRSTGREFHSRARVGIKWFLPGWVIVCGQVNTLGI